MQRCWFCDRVKGKRSCPARGGDLICSRCCGTKRRVEIQCPADCPYLHGAHDSRWSSRAQEKEAARFFAKLFALEERPAQFYVFLVHVMTSATNPLSALGDRELLEVVETAAKTLETLGRGLLYSHPASPHLQRAADWLVRIVTSRKKIEAAPDASDEEVLLVLRSFAAAVEEQSRESSRERYLELAQRLLAEPLAEAPALRLPDDLDALAQRLIVPPSSAT